MNVKPFLLLASALLVSACQWSVTEETVGQTNTRELCGTVTAARHGNASAASSDLAMAELRERGEFSAQELRDIETGNIRIGMTEHAGLCAAGYHWYGRNETITASGTRAQYVMGDGQYNPRWYLYTENGRVSAIQR